MDSQLAIHTIKESCYQVGYPTHHKEHERRKLINQSCDYAIECIDKLNKIEQIVEQYQFYKFDGFLKIKEVLEQE